MIPSIIWLLVISYLPTKYLMQSPKLANKMWSLGLLKSMKDPKQVVYSDQKLVIIKDAFPKAKYHFLAIPHEDIASIKHLTEKHLPLLEYMEEKGEDYMTTNLPDVNFKMGYHAKPSMLRLHLHIISNDMISPSLKNKKHWNSFNTEFFLNSTDVIKNLKLNGSIEIPNDATCEKFLNRKLKCNQCNEEFSNIPKLKSHLISHS